MDYEQFEKQAVPSYIDRYKQYQNAKDVDKVSDEILITSHLGLVVKVAKKYLNSGWSFDDLFQEGVIGLIYAIREQHSLQNNIITIHIEKAIKTALAKQFHKTEAIYRKYSIITLDEKAWGFIPDEINMSPEEFTAKSCLSETMNELLKTLSPREEYILKHRFDFYNTGETSLRQVGKQLNLSRECIRQIERRSLRMLRHPSRSKKLKDFIDEFEGYYYNNFWRQALPKSYADTMDEYVVERCYPDTKKIRGLKMSDIEIEVLNVEEMNYANGGEGFHIYMNIKNTTSDIIKVKLKTCTVFKNKMNQSYEYHLTGYSFFDEILFPDEIKTFAPIWITGKWKDKHLKDGDTLTVILQEPKKSKIHHFKFAYDKFDKDELWKLISYHSC